MMNGQGKSDRPEVPEKSPNNAGPPGAEGMEGRGLAKGNLPDMGQWLRSVVSGHIRYYGVPMNAPALHIFRFQIGWLWHRALSRRSQNGRIHWDRMRRLINRWLPPVRIFHDYPLRRMGVVT